MTKTHAGEQWTKSRYFQFIRSALRQAFSRYPVKFQAKNAARRELKRKKGNQKYEFQCAECKKWYKSTEVDVDHIHQAGSLTTYAHLPGFVERLFCEAEGLQVLCKPCHKLKTASERRKKSA